MNQRSTLLADRMQMAQKLVEVPYSIVEKQHPWEAQGKISRGEAQRRALETINPMRHDDGNYFWINDEHPTMITHPLKPRKGESGCEREK
jgi:methyl-accepting chemotaxis protein